MEINSNLPLAVLGPQVDVGFWRMIFSAGMGEVTSVPAATVEVLQLRTLPSPVMIANGRNYNPVLDNPAMLVPGR